MRTRPSNLIGACIWCNNDHDPSNQCREMPENPRFQMSERKPKPRKRVIPIKDRTGKVIGSRTEWEQ